VHHLIGLKTNGAVAGGGDSGGSRRDLSGDRGSSFGDGFPITVAFNNAPCTILIMQGIE